jgi:hypothetical protein
MENSDHCKPQTCRVDDTRSALVGKASRRRKALIKNLGRHHLNLGWKNVYEMPPQSNMTKDIKQQSISALGKFVPGKQVPGKFVP